MTRRFLLLCLLLPGWAYAEPRTLAVPDDYPTIQAAIDVAAPGDTVTLKPGEYEGPVTFKNGITLKGESRDTVTLWRNAVEGSVLTAENCPEGAITGITFEHRAPETKPAEDFQYSAAVFVRSSGITISECVFRNSPHIGIEAAGRPGPTVRRCLATGNAGYGIYYHARATGHIEGNTVTDSGFSGISIEESGTSPLVKDNTSSRNGTHGILIRYDARPEVRDNTVSDNTEGGITVVGPGTRPLIAGNTVTGNKTSDIWLPVATRARVEGNKCSKNGYTSAGHIGLLLADGKFDDLEAYADFYRTETPVSEDGGWMLNDYYDGVANGASEINESNQEKYFAQLDKWIAAYPTSVTPLVAKARAHIAYGWKSRGSGWASSVTAEGWKGFRSNFNKAWQLLEKADTLPNKDPELYAAWVEVGMGLGRDEPPGGPVLGGLMDALGLTQSDLSETEEIFRKGLAVEPAYYPLCTSRLHSLLPRWGGSPDEIMATIDRIVDASRSREGEGMYARMATYVLDTEEVDSFRDDYRFSWSRLEQAFNDLKTRYPKGLHFRDWQCRMACAFSKRETALSLFNEVGDNWFSNVWYNEYHRNAWRAWARGEGDMPPTDQPPLHEAAEDGDRDEVIALLKNGADVNARDAYGYTALTNAAQDQHWDIVEALLDKGADPKAEKSGMGWSPLAMAVYGKRMDLVKKLIEKGADPNERLEDDHTPISVAIIKENEEAAVYLLDHGADPNLPGVQGWPLLAGAISLELPKVVDKLIEKGAKLDTLSPEGRNALHHAAQSEDAETTLKLLEKGADVNARANDGGTALYGAARKGADDVVKILLDHGADPTLAHEDGLTPLAAAEKEKHASTVDLLKAHAVSK